jgi:sulfide dehydrogenase [flavocytochrome c] flavoprotein subunit
LTNVKINRRNLFGFSAGLIASKGIASANIAGNKSEVVIIGGGFGGVSAARALNRIAPQTNITLILDSHEFITCPFSNAVIAGFKELREITFRYDKLNSLGLNIIVDPVMEIEPLSKFVKLKSGQHIQYDRLIISPGISFKWDSFGKVNSELADIFPHAWKAGEQTLLLRNQILSMRQGGTIIIAPPDNPFRCPPGPYERASLIAHYLKFNNPTAKILIIDAKNKFSKQSLFMSAWEELYPGIISFIPFSDHAGIKEIDVKNKKISTYFEDFQADVINLIPPQRAADLAINSGLSGSGDWCEVDGLTFESKVFKNIHILGDAAIVGDMPKSGFSAATQGKACAHVVNDILNDKDPETAILMNTCYSLVGPEYGISVAGVYKSDRENQNRLSSVPGAGGTSEAGKHPELRQNEAAFAKGWYANLTNEMFGI